MIRLMLAQDLPFGSDDDPLRVDPQADRPVGEGSRHAVAVAFKVNETGRRYALGVLDEAVKRPRPIAMRLAISSAQTSAMVPGSDAMRDLPPLLDAAFLQPGIQCVQVGKGRQLVAKAGGARPGRSSRLVPSPSQRPDCRTPASNR